MSLDFPSAPTPNQRFVSEGRTFVWNGALWLMEAENIPWASLEQALAGTSTDTFMSPAAMRAAVEAVEQEPADYGPLTCRAWARIAGGTGAISASRNIASCVMSPEGQYAITFQTPMPNANYIVHGNNRFNDEKLTACALRINVNPTVNGFTLTNSTTGGSGVVGVPRGTGTISMAVFL